MFTIFVSKYVNLCQIQLIAKYVQSKPFCNYFDEKVTQKDRDKSKKFMAMTQLFGT
jgi:hypothetical protein